MSRPRILIVEDNPDNRTLLTDILSAMDYGVIEADRWRRWRRQGRGRKAGSDPDGPLPPAHGRLDGHRHDQSQHRAGSTFRSSP